MFDDLRDPFPPTPTSDVRTAVHQRSRRILRRRRTFVGVAGSLGIVAVVLAGAAFLDGPRTATTEVAGVTQSSATTGSENVSSPVTEPVPATGPLSATVTGDLTVPDGFTLVDCTVNGAVVEVADGTFRVEGLRSGTVVDVVCTAESGDGAARAARESVELVEGDQTIQLEL